MYTREQASSIRQEFWTRFGRYMAPVLSAEGEKINWINYKTGIRQLNFRMDATQEFAHIGIEINHRDPGQALVLYQQFELLKPMLESVLGEAWEWAAAVEPEDQQVISSIALRQYKGSIFKEADWPDIISFLKPRIIKLDEFWCEYKMIFEMMG